MSGGPVFADPGYLAGIICSNLPPDVDGGEHTSYVSTLWPLLGIMIAFDRPGHPIGQLYPAIELIKDRYMEAVDIDKIAMQIDPHTEIAMIRAGDSAVAFCDVASGGSSPRT